MPTEPSDRRKQYLEKLKDPRWQKMRLQILERDEWSCCICYDRESTLHVHHRFYTKGIEPWDYPPEALVTLCESCHEEESENRYAEEQLLLRALRKHFFSGDVNCLARGFELMEPQHVPEILATALEWMLTNSDAQRAVVDQYFAHLKAKREDR